MLEGFSQRFIHFDTASTTLKFIAKFFHSCGRIPLTKARKQVLSESVLGLHDGGKQRECRFIDG
jgi:hypothetical protein